MANNFNSYNQPSGNMPDYYGVNMPEKNNTIKEIETPNTTDRKIRVREKPQQNSTNKPVSKQNTNKGKRKVPSPKGLIAMGTPIVAVLLIFVIIAAIIAGANRSKIQVNTASVKVGEMQTVYSHKGYLYGSENSGVYNVAFIDDDYAEHGIQISSTGTINNPTDDSVLNLVVKSIKEYDDLNGSDEDSQFYKYILDLFGSENETTEEVAETENDVTDETEEESESETEAEDSHKHHVVIMTVSKSSDENLTIQPEQFVDVEIVTYQNPNAFSVPTAAIIDKDNVSYVLAVSGNKVRKINVSKGAVAGDQTEIISTDISENLVVVKKAIGTDISSIEDGTKIKVVKEAG